MKLFRRLPLWAAALAALCASSSSVLITPAVAQEAEADDAETLARLFGTRSSVLDISLSPSGTKVAWVASGPGHFEALNVYDLEGDGEIKRITSNTEIVADLSSCDWATDTRLLCNLYGLAERTDGLLLGYTCMFAVDYDGSNPKQITRSQSFRDQGFNQDGGDIVALDVAGEDGKLLITRNWVPQSSIGTQIQSKGEGLGVELLDIETGKRRTREKPDVNASFFIADETGVLRLKARDLADKRGVLSGRRVFLVRDNRKAQWETLDGVTLGGAVIENFSPVAVDAGRNSVLAYQTINGFTALIEIPLSGEQAATIIARREDADIDGLVRIGRQRRVVGVTYATEKRSVEYFDPDLAKLASGLMKALPNQPIISIVGASSDENRLLIIASSDTDPGSVYVYDKTTRRLEVLLAMREALVDRPMGTMTPVTYPAADGTEIPGYLTLPNDVEAKNLPTIVLPHGGPAARDYWGFDWLVQFFTARGYAVLQPNYRGSAGYGEAWFGRNGYQAWDVAIGDVNDAGRWMVSQGIADPEKLVIMGWSYGGYAALQSQVMDPALYKAVVAIAPVTDLEFLRDDARGFVSFKLRDRQLGSGPHIAAGSPRRHAEKFAAPVALFHGTRDANVRVRHSQKMADALQDAGKRVQYSEFEDLEHSLRDSNARAKMLMEIDAFLEQSLAG